MDEKDNSSPYENTSHRLLIKYIYDLSKEMNIEGARGVMGNELELIALVRNCRFLYDRTMIDFKDNEKKSIAWNAIANVMHSTVDEVQLRWKNLRESYSRYKRELNVKQTETAKFWEYHEDMKFLDPYIIHRRSLGRVSTPTNSIKNFKEEPDVALCDSSIDLLKFIKCIEERPVLYDSKHANYRSKEHKQDAWNEIAQILGISVLQCECRWKSLRERYGRERKHKDRIDKQWIYFNHLSFLDSHVRTRRLSRFRPILTKSDGAVEFESPTSSDQHEVIIDHTENVIDEIEEQNLEFVNASTAVQSRCSSQGSPKEYTSFHYENPHDEDDLFGETITAELKRIPSGKKKMKIKAEIYKIFCEYESD